MSISSGISRPPEEAANHDLEYKNLHKDIADRIE